MAFALSEGDKASPNPRLSVFAEDLTTLEQACALVGPDPKHRFVLRLGVDAIRALRPVPDAPDVPGLGVEWERLFITDVAGARVPDCRPGAEGHAGITGLLRGGPVTKLHAKSLRSQLADMAAVLPLAC